MTKKPTAGILFVSSYPPRECGIATYTQDLMRAIREKFHSSFNLWVCALENRPDPTGKRYRGKPVRYVLNTNDPEDYLRIAREVNKDPQIQMVFIQHEFGLFSGPYGAGLLYLLYTLNKPVITAFHTVLPNPEPERKQMVMAISECSSSLVTMTRNSAKLLRDVYGISRTKIAVVPHGTHFIDPSEARRVKQLYQLGGKFVLSTFGLINPGKGIETALEALPAIVDKFPDTMYLLIGKTHPEVVRNEGERYRHSLEEQVLRLGLRNHVMFVNRYVSRRELLQYLQMTDVYLFTSLDPNQAVSGTFVYAQSAGCPVVATPFPHALELLGEEPRMIVQFGQKEELAQAVIALLSNDEQREQQGLEAVERIRPTSWPNSAVKHARLFAAELGTASPLSFAIPDISLKHLIRLTTLRGIIQFSRHNVPDPASGYTLDDNSRALIAMLRHLEITGSAADLPMIETYFRFILFARQADGSFMNYVDDRGNYQEKNHYVNLEDSSGRAVWALGELLASPSPEIRHLKLTAEFLFDQAIRRVTSFTSPRAMAFVIKGLYFRNRYRSSAEVRSIIRRLADGLVRAYEKSTTGNWRWFEESLTYANSVIPEALLYAHLATRSSNYRTVALASFGFLRSILFRRPDRIQVISNRGWYRNGDPLHQHGQQPIDVAYTILALNLFYETTGDETYLTEMETAFSWFQGNNHLGQIIYNPDTGGCRDGLEENAVNLNEGAESTVCYLLARLIMERRPTAGQRTYTGATPQTNDRSFDLTSPNGEQSKSHESVHSLLKHQPHPPAPGGRKERVHR